MFHILVGICHQSYQLGAAANFDDLVNFGDRRQIRLSQIFIKLAFEFGCDVIFMQLGTTPSTEGSKHQWESHIFGICHQSYQLGAAANFDDLVKFGNRRQIRRSQIFIKLAFEFGCDVIFTSHPGSRGR